MRLSRLVWLGLLAAIAYAGFFWVPPGPRRPGAYDPSTVAAYQLEIFEAYDRASDVDMFTGYVGMLREQNKYSWFRSVQAGFHMARAHLKFRTVHNHYEQLIPDLMHAYTIERDWLGSSFDPEAVSRAELGAWLGSREHPDRVIETMTESFAKRDALRFNVTEGTVRGPASLYARAAQMRDQDDTDWGTVGMLLADAAKAIAVSITVR
jgi:hypothetical protein